MIRKELQAYIDALTDEQIAGLKTVHLMDGAAADAMVTQSNAKDATIAQAKTDFDAAAEKAKENQAVAVKIVQDKLDALTKQAPLDQQAAVDAAREKAVTETTASLQPQIDALTTVADQQNTKILALGVQVSDQKAMLDKYAVLLSAKDAGPLADQLKLQAKKESLAKQIIDAQATKDKAMTDLAALG